MAPNDLARKDAVHSDSAQAVGVGVYFYHMEITAFIAQFMGYFLAIVGGTMLLKRKTVELALKNVLRDRGTMYVVGILEVAGGLLLVLSHPSWTTLFDKTVSALSWFLLLEGVFYLVATQKQIMGLLKFLHKESVYYVIALAYVVVGAALLLGA